MSTYFDVNIPLSGQDQDAPPVANDKFLIVCDGLGGDGSGKHIVSDTNETEKSAYLGSRILSETCAEFFEDNYEDFLSEEKIKDAVSRLKDRINESLTASLTKYPKSEEAHGGMIFPTTLAAVVYRECDEHIEATAIWAGDSRVYMITDSDWLQQLSRDDVVGEFDACFGKDCRMSNCISQDVPFTINYACYKLPKQCVVFACSDGCFDFTKSPMHFEMKMLEALFNAKEFDSDILSESFSSVLSKMNCGDDCTLAGVAFNCEAEKIKESVRERVTPLKNLITDFSNAEQTYEKSINDKKSEIRTLTSENRRLSLEIANQQKSVVLSAFKEDVCDKEESAKDKTLLGLSSLLKSEYQPYADYFSELQAGSEKVKNNQQIIDSYKVVYDKLRDLVDFAEREKRLRDKKDKGPSIPNFNIFSKNPKNTQPSNPENAFKVRECIMYIGQLESLLSGIKQNVEGNAVPAVTEQLSNLADNIIRVLGEFDEPATQTVIYDEKTRASVLSVNELNKTVVPYVHKNGVAHYKGYIDEQKFEELSAVYEEHRTMFARVSAMNSEETKEKPFEEIVKDFETSFLKIHMMKMAEFLANFDEINSLIPAQAQYQANIEKLKAIEGGLDGEKDSQRQVWLKYKDNYEFYKNCCCFDAV